MSVYLSIIIPAYNEEKRIATVLDAIVSFMANKDYNYEVIVVDDGSIDDTVAVVNSYQQQLSNLTVMTQTVNHGKGYAVRIGMLNASGRYRLFLDADNATQFDDINSFWQYIENGHDIVIGSRYLQGSKIVIKQPLYRRLLGRVANLLIQILAVWGIKDTQCGFKLFTAKASEDIFSCQVIDRWGFDFEILAIAQKKGYKIKELPVSWHHIGESRVRPIKGALKTLWELLIIKKNLLIGLYNKKQG